MRTTNQNDLYAYERIVDIADKIYRKHAHKKAETSEEDRKAIFSVLKEAGFLRFNRVMDTIQEEAASDILKMDILEIAAFYGGKAFRHDFLPHLRNAKIVHAVFSKLAPAEVAKLKGEKTALGYLIEFTPENCNKALLLSEENLAISRSERVALREFLFKEGCLEEPSKKESQPEVKGEAKVLSIAPVAAEVPSTNGKEKKAIAS